MKRVNWMFTALAGVLVILCVRSAWLIQSAPTRAAASLARQERMILPEPGRPGSILGRCRNGYVLLAGSRQAPMCYADPSLIKDEDLPGVVVRVGEALQIDPIVIQETILSRNTRRFVSLKRDLADSTAEAVSLLGIAGVRIKHEWVRQYPCGDLARTVLGFRYADGSAGGGLEQSQNDRLSGRDGRRVVRCDAARRAIWFDPLAGKAPQDGNNVVLCLDVVVQGYLHQAVADAVEKFSAKWGTGVVVNPMTGEILAMTSVTGAGTPKRPRGADMAISMPYEPGSVMKPIFAAAAVDMGLVSYSDTFFCENGAFHPPRGGRISDHHAYGNLSFTDVIVKSSNIGMAKLGLMLGNDRLHEIVRRFGFGSRTAADLPDESKGMVRPLEKWDTYSTPRVPFGHEMSVTALQLTMAFSALANGGELLRPRLVDHVRDPAGKVIWRGTRQVVRRVLSAEVAQQTLDVLAQVVERGTGRSSRLDHWTSFGKTGTAEIPGPGGYVQDAYAGTFVGGAPADKPKVLCLITIYWPDRAKGYYGGTVAAPRVKEVLRKTLVYLETPADRPGSLIADRGFSR